MTLSPRFDPYRAAMVPSVIPLAKAAEPEMPPVVYTLLGVPYTVVPDRRHGFLFKAARRKPAPGQMSFFDAPKPPKAPGTGGRKKMQEGATRMKNGRQQVLKNSRWRNTEPKGKATPKPGLSILSDDTGTTLKPKARKGKSWQPSPPAKAPAAVGGEAMGATTLRPKAKPTLPMPSVLGDEDIFENDALGDQSHYGYDAAINDAPATSSTLKPKGESKKSTSPQYKLGPSETNHYLVDVSGITSTVPRSAFDADQIESLAQSILESGGLLSPIVLKQTGPESFEVLAGNLEYHAAARAKELDPRKGEMVNAYVVPPQNQAAAVEQVNRAKPTVRPKKSDSTSPQYKLGPSETKHYLVDVSGITSTVPRSAFDADQVESLAQSILESGGLLSPIVLKQTGPESYEVLAGDLEYHAAARAKELDPRKGEMVSAYVVPPQNQAAAVAQVTPATPVKAEVVADDEPTTLRPKIRSRAERQKGFDDLKNTMQDAARSAIRGAAEVADFYEGTVAAVADGLGMGDDIGEVGGNRAMAEAMLAERDPLQAEPTTLRPKRTRAERKQDFDGIKQNLYDAGVSTVQAAQTVQQMGDTAAGAVADAYGLDLDDDAGLGGTNAPQLEPTLGDMLSEQKAIAGEPPTIHAERMSKLSHLANQALEVPPGVTRKTAKEGFRKLNEALSSGDATVPKLLREWERQKISPEEALWRVHSYGQGQDPYQPMPTTESTEPASDWESKLNELKQVGSQPEQKAGATIVTKDKELKDAFVMGQRGGKNPGVLTSPVSNAFVFGQFLADNGISGEVKKGRGSSWSVGSQTFKVDGDEVTEVGADSAPAKSKPKSTLRPKAERNADAPKPKPSKPRKTKKSDLGFRVPFGQGSRKRTLEASEWRTKAQDNLKQYIADSSGHSPKERTSTIARMRDLIDAIDSPSFKEWDIQQSDDGFMAVIPYNPHTGDAPGPGQQMIYHMDGSKAGVIETIS